MKCPGSDITISVFSCPNCGEDVEMFTGEASRKCANCQTVVHREKASCIEWCEFATQCFKTADVEEARKKAAAEKAEYEASKKASGSGDPGQP